MVTNNVKIYNLFVRNKKGEKVYLTGFPMSHEDCRIMKSKQSDRTINRIQFEEAN